MSRLSIGKVCRWWNKVRRRIRLCFMPRLRCNEPLFIPRLDWVLTLATDNLEKVRCGNYAGVLWMERVGDWRLHHTASPTWCLSPRWWADVQMASTWSLMNALVFLHQRGGSVWWLEKGWCHQGKSSAENVIANTSSQHTHMRTHFPKLQEVLRIGWQVLHPVTISFATCHPKPSCSSVGGTPHTSSLTS